MFSFYELDEIMRQRGEWEFCRALNNMAEGSMTQKDIDLLKSRQICPLLEPPREAIWLFPYNKECREHNSKVHSLLLTEGSLSEAWDKVVGEY